MQYFYNQNRNVWDRRNGKGPANAGQRERLYSEKELMSKPAILGKSSSLREDMVLIPGADWVELQISWGRANRKGASGLFGQAPQCLPLPSKLDPLSANGLSSADGIVVYSLTAANFNSARVKSNDDLSRLNARANAALWDAIRNGLPPPTDRRVVVLGPQLPREVPRGRVHGLAAVRGAGPTSEAGAGVRSGERVRVRRPVGDAAGRGRRAAGRVCGAGRARAEDREGRERADRVGASGQGVGRDGAKDDIDTHFRGGGGGRGAGRGHAEGAAPAGGGRADGAGMRGAAARGASYFHV